MQTPADLRKELRLTRDAIGRESSPALKRELIRHGFVLAQIVQKIERDEAARYIAVTTVGSR